MSDSLKHSSNLAPVWDIFCDFDGTITFFDVTDSLLERFAQPEWTAIEEEWAQGRIGSKKCLSRQVQLLDMSLAELDDHLNQIDVDPGFAAFLMAAQNRGFPITIVSDGLDYSIRSILGRHKIHGLPIFANKLHQAGERKWRITFPHAGRNCDFASGHCKCATIGRMQPTARRKVLQIDPPGAIAGFRGTAFRKAFRTNRCTRSTGKDKAADQSPGNRPFAPEASPLNNR